jgi:hypothetical protein
MFISSQEGKMKLFRELKITGNPETLERVIENIEKSLDNGWSRDRQAEAEVNDDESSPLKRYCFSCTEVECRPGSRLWISGPWYGRLFVFNIIPTTVLQLSYDEYNSILAEFYGQFVVSAIQGMDVEISLTDGDLSLEKLMSPKTIEILRKFTQESPHYKGSVMINQELWYNFLVAAHKDDAKLDPDTLEHWLREDEGWSEDMAFKLAEQYDSARLLLDYYDTHHL